MKISYKLVNRQIEGIAEIFSNLGLLFFGSIIIPLFTEGGKFNPILALVGFLLTLFCWFVTIVLLREIKS